MSVNNFKPEIWWANLEVGLENQAVAGAVANREYEGEVKKAGDVVRVTFVGDPTIRTYTQGSDITIDAIPTTQRNLPIDQEKYFSHEIPDVDAVQAKPGLMETYTMRGGYQLAQEEDTFILGLHAQSGMQIGSDSAPVLVNTLNIERKCAQVAKTMDDAGVEQAGRFCIVPPWFRWKMVEAGLNTLTDNAALYRTGFVGTVFDIDFLWSQNVVNTSGAKYKIMAGVRGQSWAAASQLLEFEAFRPEKRFEDAIKALHVYGAKIMRPDKTLALTANEVNE